MLQVTGPFKALAHTGPTVEKRLIGASHQDIQQMSLLVYFSLFLFSDGNNAISDNDFSNVKSAVRRAMR